MAPWNPGDSYWKLPIFRGKMAVSFREGVWVNYYNSKADWSGLLLRRFPYFSPLGVTTTGNWVANNFSQTYTQYATFSPLAQPWARWAYDYSTSPQSGFIQVRRHPRLDSCFFGPISTSSLPSNHIRSWNLTVALFFPKVHKTIFLLLVSTILIEGKLVNYHKLNIG